MGYGGSGLRLSEALRLSWDTREPVSVLLQPGYRPVLCFQAKEQKGRRAEMVPCAPKFAETLEAVPEADRAGRVFDVQYCRTRAGNVVSKIGRAAGIVTNPDTKKPATAQDYRRSFGTRWAKRVMPVVLKALMRHRDIKTTLGYYVDQQADDVAETVWEAYQRAEANGNTLSNTPR